MTARSGPSKGFTLGVLKGLWYGVGRTAHGVFETGTFWLPNHRSNENVGIPFDAPFAWEGGKPSYEYGAPMGDKLVRGVIDLVTGWMEVPGQPVHLWRTRGRVWGLAGVVKGVWTAAGRAASGVNETVLFWLPNPIGTAGYPLDSLRSFELFSPQRH